MTVRKVCQMRYLRIGDQKSFLQLDKIFYQVNFYLRGLLHIGHRGTSMETLILMLSMVVTYHERLNSIMDYFFNNINIAN